MKAGPLAWLSGGLALPLTVVRYAELWFRGPPPRLLREIGFSSALGVVYRLHFARLMRRLMKIGLDGTLGLRPLRVRVEGSPENLQASCVLAFLHSPWNEVLIREIRDRRLCLALTDGVWSSSLGPFHAGSGLARLRHALGVLRAGGRVAVVADDFDDHRFLPARFLNVPVRVRTGIPRLAAIADVPIVPLTAAYRRGHIRVRVGPKITVARTPDEQSRAIEDLFRFFETEVRRSPDAWGRIFRFLRAAPSAATAEP